MVGSAQYRDEEIAWILTAVVEKKGQDFIQDKFEDKFGRPLNHNQIRYIKNKYGKDPKFNSPLVNIRSAKIATSPSSSLLGSNDQDDAASVATTTFSERQRRNNANGSSSKRKRSLEDTSRQSSVPHTAKMPRLNPLTRAGNTPRIGTVVMDTPQWNAVGAQATGSLHSLSPPPATPEALYGNLSMYDTSQQLMQGTGGVTWPPSMNNMWNLGEHASLMNSRHIPPSTFFQNATSSPVELSYHFGHTPASYAFSSPLGAYNGPPHMSQPYAAHLPNMSPPPFSPSIRHAVYSPLFTELQQPQLQQPPLQRRLQHQYSPSRDSNVIQACADPSSAGGLSPLVKNETPFPGLPVDPSPLSAIPSLEELPILPADYTHSPGGTTNPYVVTYAPYEPLPFEPVPDLMPWPFESVRDVGLTAVSSADIRRDVQERERHRRRRDEGAALAAVHNMHSTGLHIRLPTHRTGFDTLDAEDQFLPRGTQIVDGAQYAATVYARALASSLNANTSPSTTATTSDTQQSQVEYATTIDPRLLTDEQLAATFTIPARSRPDQTE